MDGSTVPLQGIPPADLPRLQELRQRASQSGMSTAASVAPRGTQVNRCVSDLVVSP